MFMIPCTTKMTNSGVLSSINKERELLTTIKKRKTAYLGNVLGNEKYEYLPLLIKAR